MPVEASEHMGERSAEEPALALELRGVSKRFGLIQANDRVDFEIGPGEIRGLVGENGAGKSTLMTIASGLYQPDEGEVWVGGQRRKLRGREDAIELGINMVHQNFMLVDDCTVAQNVILGQPGKVLLNLAEVEAKVRELGKRYGIEVDPSMRAGQLTPTERQRIEILAALWRGRRILILDEPTSVLAPGDVENLFETMRRLAAEGCAIVFTSHKLREVIEVCDTISVMRHGRLVVTVDRGETDPEDLAERMVGKGISTSTDTSLLGLEDEGHEQERLRRRGTRGETVLRLRDLYAKEGEVSELTCASGEIVGIAGVEGNGQQELAAALAGLSKTGQYRVELDGRDITDTGVRERVAAGISYIPEDPASSALVPSFPLTWNLALRVYRSPRLRTLKWLVNLDALRNRAEEAIDEFDMRGATPDVRTAALSGGNRQKVVLARELNSESRLLIVVDPTVGLDVGASQNVYTQLRAHRDRGAAIVLNRPSARTPTTRWLPT